MQIVSKLQLQLCGIIKCPEQLVCDDSVMCHELPDAESPFLVLLKR